MYFDATMVAMLVHHFFVLCQLLWMLIGWLVAVGMNVVLDSIQRLHLSEELEMHDRVDRFKLLQLYKNNEYKQT